MASTTQEVLEVSTRTLAVGCLHLLVNHATLEFPGSTRAAPSHLVVVALTPRGPLWNGAVGYFPFSVPWNVWQQVVAPVLEDDTMRIVDPTDGSVNHLNAGEPNTTLVGKIQSALIANLVEYGYAPDPGGSSTATLVADPVGAGEPVNLTPEIPDDETYQRVDEGSERPTYAQFDV